MFNAYRRILSLPGALAFSFAGFIARFPMSMVGVSTVLMTSMVYGSYELAGQVTAVSVISYAIGAPILSRLVDRYGQARVMVPSLIISILALGVMAVAGYLHLHPVWIYLTAIVSAFFSGSLGSFVRSRWVKITKTPEDLHSAFSLEAALDEVVYMLGPVIATFAATQINPVGGLVAAAIFVILGGFWFLSQRSTEPAPDPHARPKGTKSVIRTPAMLAIAVVYAFAGGVLGTLNLAVVAFTEMHHWRSAAGIILAVMSFGSFLSALFYGARRWEISQTKLFAVGLFVLAAGTSLTALVGGVWQLSLAIFITGMAISPTLTNVNKIVQQLVPARELTEGLTWLSAALNIGSSLCSAVVGRIIDANGAHAGFWFAAGIAGAMVVVGMMTVPIVKRALERAEHATVIEVLDEDAE